MRKSCRSRKMLKLEYLIAKIGVDAADNECESERETAELISNSGAVTRIRPIGQLHEGLWVIRRNGLLLGRFAGRSAIRKIHLC